MPAFWCSDLCKACWTVSGLRLQAYGHRGTGLGSQAESLSTLPLRPGIRGVSSEERGGLLGSVTVGCMWLQKQPLQDRGVAWFIFAFPVQSNPGT